MSSMIIYGESAGGGKRKVITRETRPHPANFYGDSKWQADKGVRKLQDNTFHVAVIRPPMIYGKDSKGNYPKLAKAARILPIFPDIYNERSMLHIDNLSEFLRLIITNNDKGLFFPQNREYVKTSDLVKIIAEIHNKKIYLTKIFNPILYLLINRMNLVNKVFGNLMYDLNESNYKEEYRLVSFKESLKRTEKLC